MQNTPNQRKQLDTIAIEVQSARNAMDTAQQLLYIYYADTLTEEKDFQIVNIRAALRDLDHWVRSERDK